MEMSYDISTNVERLILSVVLILVIGPIFKLDGRIGACRHAAGDGVDLVALVAGLELRHVVYHLLCELTLCGRV